MTLKYMPQIASVPLSLIDVPKERRRLKKATVAEIADSVRVVGLLQPIGLRPIGDRYRLVFGRHRLEAFCMLGRDEIPAIPLELDDVAEASAADAENLFWNAFSPAERLLALKRWHARHEDAHDESHNKKGVQPNQHNTDGILSTPLRHPDDKPSRTMKPQLATTGGFSEEELVVLADHEVGREDLSIVAKIQDPNRRRSAISMIANGLSVKEAIATACMPANATHTSVLGNDVVVKAEGDMTDEEWLESYCSEILAKLKYQAIFKKDALLWRTISDGRHKFRAATKKALSQSRGQLVGPYFLLTTKLVNTDHPRSWLHCGPCGGTGMSGDASRCGYCYGHGYSTRTSPR